MKTLLLALISPGKSRGTREGAVRGLMGVGKEAVRKGLVDAGGARLVANECTGASPEESALLKAVMVRIISQCGSTDKLTRSPGCPASVATHNRHVRLA